MPNNFMEGTLVGIVVGGDVNDPARDQSGNMKIFLPGLHGKDVKKEHLAFSTMMKQPTNAGQQIFEGCLDPGTVVFVRKDTGSNQCHILGCANEIYDPSARVPGNADLLNSIPLLKEALQRTIGIRIPPKIQESSQNGVKVRKIQEKGQEHKHALLAGIPSNGAIYPLAGSIVPQVQNIATAIQSFDSILTPALASILPGVSLSLGDMLTSLATGKLTGSLISNVLSDVLPELPGEITGAVGAAAASIISPKQMREFSKMLNSKLTPSMLTTFQSMALLTSSIETGTGGGFTSGSKADPMTYMENAVDLLGQCDSIGDMVSCMQQLQYDDSLLGQENLPNITMMVDTPFGIKMPLSISPSGMISQNIPEPLKLAISAFSSAMSSASGFPGVNPGENLFGGSAKTMFDMFQRLSPEAQKIAIEVSKKLNQSEIAQVFDKTVKANNPFQVMFKK